MTEFTVRSLLAKKDAVQARIPSKLSQSCYVSLFGPTGAGKSTLISCLMDLKMIQFTQECQTQYKINHPKTNLMPQIGNSCNSQTELPAIYQKGQTNYLDLPGIFDTKGTEQEIVNAFANSLMFRKDNTFKFLIVIEYASLQQSKGSAFVDVINRVEALLGENIPLVAKSCCIIITKVNSLVDNKQIIKNKIDSILSYNRRISQNTQSHKLVRSILQGGQLLLFPFPQYITSQRIAEIEDQIKELQPFILKNDANVSLSDASINFLQREVNNRMDLIEKNIEEISHRITAKYRVNYHNGLTANSNHRDLERAEQYKAKLNLQGTSFPLNHLLHDISLDNLPQTSNVIKISEELKKLESFYPEATQGYQSLFDQLFNTIAICKGHVQNEKLRIRDKQQVERRKKEAQQQRRQAELEYQQYLRAMQEEQEQRQRQERDRIARERQFHQRQLVLQELDHAINIYNAQRQAQLRRLWDYFFNPFLW